MQIISLNFASVLGEKLLLNVSFKNEIILHYQWANLNFDISVLIICRDLAEMQVFKVRSTF